MSFVFLFRSKTLHSILLLPLFVSALACSSTSTGTPDDTTTGISNIEDIPNTTDPVVADAASLVTAPLYSVAIGSTTDINDFNGGNGSYASCEMINRMRGSIGMAAQGAQILCFMQQMFADNDDILDGEYHVFDLSFSDASEDMGAPDHLKVKVEKDGDVITSFEMFACSNGTQTQYFSGNFDGTSITMINKGTSETGGDSSVAYSGTVTGEVNSDGSFVGEKVVELAYINSFGDTNSDSIEDGNYCDTTTTATDSTIEFSGYCRNTGSNTGDEEIYAMADLEDNDAATVEDWGLGAGAAKIVSDNNTAGDLVTQGWNASGDIDESSAYLSDADFVAGTQPTASNTEPDVAFTSDQTYDCATTAEATVNTFTISTLETACEDYSLTQDHIECQDGTDL